MMWWGSGFAWIWMLLFWAAVLGIAVWAVSAIAGTNARRGGDTPSARSILDERFASGEIDRDEYRQRRDELAR